jgi:hypothetical protein
MSNLVLEIHPRAFSATLMNGFPFISIFFATQIIAAGINQCNLRWTRLFEFKRRERQNKISLGLSSRNNEEYASSFQLSINYKISRKCKKLGLDWEDAVELGPPKSRICQVF